MPVTLCSYTYNDGRLLDGLLASLADWTTQPERLMLVDDGSHPAYVLQDLPLPTSLLRHPVNKGVAVAKKAGLDAATSPLVLSLDCDTRLDPDWLARCLPRMQNPKVALCGSTLRCNPGQDTVSQFMARFGDAAQAEAAGPADFVPGNVWLIKKAAWDAVQGFGPHSAAVGEDHALCGRLRDAGYTLFLEPAAVATQIRKLTRTAMARRFWSWAAPHYLRGLPDEPHFLTYAVLALVPDVVTRIEQSLLWSEPRFVYLHLLYLLHCLLNLATAGVASRGYTQRPVQQIWSWLLGFVQAAPRLRALLRRDLARLGHAAPPGAARAACPELAELLAPLTPLRDMGVLATLEQDAVPRLLAEQDAVSFDFSFYEDRLGSAAGQPGRDAS